MQYTNFKSYLISILVTIQKRIRENVTFIFLESSF
jgi:hypothetical protein